MIKTYKEVKISDVGYIGNWKKENGNTTFSKSFTQYISKDDKVLNSMTGRLTCFDPEVEKQGVTFLFMNLSKFKSTFPEIDVSYGNLSKIELRESSHYANPVYHDFDCWDGDVLNKKILNRFVSFENHIPYSRFEESATHIMFVLKSRHKNFMKIFFEPHYINISGTKRFARKFALLEDICGQIKKNYNLFNKWEDQGLIEDEETAMAIASYLDKHYEIKEKEYA